MATQKALPQFNYSEIPESARQALLATVHFAAIEYLKQPGVAEKYAAWLERKKQRKEENNG